MNKEKLLKSFIIRFCIESVLASSVLFIWMFAFSQGFIDEKTWCVSGLVMITLSIVGGYFHNKLYGERDKKRMMQIMPLIISINDTVESLNMEKTMFTILYLLSFSFGFAFRETSFIFVVLMASSLIFHRMEHLTGEKIKYLKNKPEGL